jgi:hypothetical protein
MLSQNLVKEWLWYNGGGNAYFFDNASSQHIMAFAQGQGTGMLLYGSSSGNSTLIPSATGGGNNTLPQGPGTLIQSTNLLVSQTAPTIAAGGCGGSAASIPSNNGTAAFTVNVGTAPTSGGCTIGLPAATTDWVCTCTDRTTNSTALFACKQTNASASTTSAVLQGFSDIAGAAAFVASDILRVSCSAY